MREQPFRPDLELQNEWLRGSEVGFQLDRRSEFTPRLHGPLCFGAGVALADLVGMQSVVPVPSGTN